MVFHFDADVSGLLGQTVESVNQPDRYHRDGYIVLAVLGMGAVFAILIAWFAIVITGADGHRLHEMVERGDKGRGAFRLAGTLVSFAIDGLTVEVVEVDAAGCTLCHACVSACPTGALIDDPERPVLRFENELVVDPIRRADSPEA